MVSADDAKIVGFEITCTSATLTNFGISLTNTTNTFEIIDCYVYKQSTNNSAIVIGHTSGTTTDLIIKNSKVVGTVTSANSDEAYGLYRIGNLEMEGCQIYAVGGDIGCLPVQCRAGDQYIRNSYLEITTGDSVTQKCLYKDVSGTVYLIGSVLNNVSGNGYEIYSGTGGTVIVSGCGHISNLGNTGAGTITYTALATEINSDDAGETVQDKIDDADAHIANTSNPHSVDKTDMSLSNVDDVQQMPLSYLDTDDALAADSDVKVPSQNAVKAYIDALLSANDAMTYKGVIDCAANPNYSAADAGDTYRISVAGKLGGGSGDVVEVGDMAICISDSTASGDQATVGEYWNIIQVNIDGNVVGTSPHASVDDNLAMFNGTSGKVIEDSGLALADVTGHIADTDNPHGVEADQVPTTDSGVTVQDALDSVESDITTLKKAALPFVIHGGGSEITTGDKGDLTVPTGFDGNITKVTLLADAPGGSIVIDVWKTTYSDFDGGSTHPADGDSITASAPPTISSATKSQDDTLTGWTKSLSAGDILRFNVDSVTTIERVTIVLEITRT